MNWLDIVILVVLVTSLFVGLKIGIISAALSFSGLIIGTILAGRYYIPLAERLPFIPPSNMAEVIAFAIILIGALIIAGLLAKLLNWLISAVMLSWLNHLGGALFGLMLGALIYGALLATWVKFWGLAKAINESKLASFLLERFFAILTLLPDKFDAIGDFFR